jgi:hypothetical protein
MTRKILDFALVSLTLVTVGQVSFAITPCVAPSLALVSWWTGDTNTTDLYGLNNPSAVNAVTLVPAEVGDGFSFGKGSYIDIPDSATLDTQRYTWGAWVMPKGPGPNDDNYGSVIVEKGIDDTDASIDLLWRDNPDDRFLFIYGSQTAELITSTDTFPPGVFYFVAATYDGTTFKLYVNGVLEGSFAETKKVTYTSAHTWEIGSGDAFYRSLGYSRTFNGIIDEVQGYKGALSQVAIQSIYKAGPGGVCKAPVVLTPTGVGFGTLPVGTTSPTKTVTVINNRRAAVTIDGFAFSGTDIADFAESSTTCGSVLAGRKSCQVSVTFTPQATGKRTAVLDVSDTSIGSPQKVNLSGTGQ